MKHHPEAREKGDISDLQEMAKGKKTKDADQLDAIEDIFEKNLVSFNKLVSQSDANKQLEKVKNSIHKV